MRSALAWLALGVALTGCDGKDMKTAAPTAAGDPGGAAERGATAEDPGAAAAVDLGVFRELPGATPGGIARPATPIPSETRQLVLATVDDWDDITAEVARFERDGGSWRPVGAAFPSVIGANGSAWGRGLHGDGPPAGATGPVKKEGDGKSPAGAFALGPAFGYAPRLPAGGRLPYTEVDASWVCVDDPASTHYNRVLDRDGIEADWSSFEAMRRRDDLYRRVLFVAHNPGAVAGAGSCIFLHLWSGPSGGTAGCTAVAGRSMETMLAWLAPAARPVFVLLSSRDRARLAADWSLP